MKLHILHLPFQRAATVFSKLEDVIDLMKIFLNNYEDWYNELTKEKCLEWLENNNLEMAIHTFMCRECGSERNSGFLYYTQEIGD